MTLRLQGGPLGSPGWRPHAVTVANLVGMRASDAIAWIDAADLYYDIPDVPALLPSDAAHLFDAYKVIDQSPAPGPKLSPGVVGGDEGDFQPTPVTLSVAPCTRRGLAFDCIAGGSPRL